MNDIASRKIDGSKAGKAAAAEAEDVDRADERHP
jgi:hypothetical protein